MTPEQAIALRCALLDLCGAYETREEPIDAHDWEAHRETIYELLEAFPDELADTAPAWVLDDEEEN